MSATPNPPVTPSPSPPGTSSPPVVPDPIPNPNSLANMQPAPPSQPTPTRTPVEDIPYYGLRSWLSQPTIASFIAGGTAGAVSRTVVSPLERLKILLQVQNFGRNEYKMSIGKALSKMWREEGWRGMMAGNGTNCIRIVPYSAVQFSSYNIYKKGFESTPGADLHPIARLLCGALAGITSVTVTYPLDIVRTRLSIQTASFAALAKEKGGSAAEVKQAAEAAKQKLPGMWGIMKQMYTSEGGLPALYRGIIPTVAGVAPYVGLNFMCYEGLRKYFTPEGERNPSPGGKLAAGAISGGLAQTCTYPLDVLRRRFQINTMSGMGYQYKGIFDAIRSIVAQEGLRGLYKGIAPNLLKVAPSMASSWLTYETTRDYFQGLKPEEDDDDI